jgi:putative Mg2+ transporter-C (MgtC) family protein
MTLWDLILRLCLSAVAGGLVGMERERLDRPAGLRTHILVCVGSALIALVSQLFPGPKSDASRIAAQIVSGIGFLGAGTIFRAGSSVRGLTTAAGLWTVAGIGMGIACGGLLLRLALFTAAFIALLNILIRAIENRWVRVYQDLVITAQSPQTVVSAVLQELQERDIAVHGVSWTTGENEGESVIRLRIRIPVGQSHEHLTPWLCAQAGVSGVEWG